MQPKSKLVGVQAETGVGVIVWGREKSRGAKPNVPSRPPAAFRNRYEGGWGRVCSAAGARRGRGALPSKDFPRRAASPQGRDKSRRSRASPAPRAGHCYRAFPSENATGGGEEESYLTMGRGVLAESILGPMVPYYLRCCPTDSPSPEAKPSAPAWGAAAPPPPTLPTNERPAREGTRRVGREGTIGFAQRQIRVSQPEPPTTPPRPPQKTEGPGKDSRAHSTWRVSGWLGRAPGRSRKLARGVRPNAQRVVSISPKEPIGSARRG